MAATTRTDLAARLRAWIEDHRADGAAVDAIEAVLDLADRMAVGIDGPNIVGQAFGTQLRDTIAVKVLRQEDFAAAVPSAESED